MPSSSTKRRLGNAIKITKHVSARAPKAAETHQPNRIDGSSDTACARVRQTNMDPINDPTRSTAKPGAKRLAVRPAATAQPKNAAHDVRPKTETCLVAMTSRLDSQEKRPAMAPNTWKPAMASARLKKVLGDADISWRLTPQLSGRVTTCPARRVCKVKCRTCGAHVTPHHGPLQLLVRGRQAHGDSLPSPYWHDDRLRHRTPVAPRRARRRDIGHS
jgi:hypothetical protein